MLFPSSRSFELPSCAVTSAVSETVWAARPFAVPFRAVWALVACASLLAGLCAGTAWAARALALGSLLPSAASSASMLRTPAPK